MSSLMKKFFSTLTPFWNTFSSNRRLILDIIKTFKGFVGPRGGGERRHSAYSHSRSWSASSAHIPCGSPLMIDIVQSLVNEPGRAKFKLCLSRLRAFIELAETSSAINRQKYHDNSDQREIRSYSFGWACTGGIYYPQYGMVASNKASRDSLF